MSTFVTLQDEVLDACQDLARFVDFHRDKVKHYLNRAQRDFARRTRCLQKKTSFTTVANQEAYTILDASNVLLVEHVRYVEDATSEYGRLLPLYPGGFANLPKEKSFGYPLNYWYRYIQTTATAEIGTFPIIATSSESLEMYHSYLPADMSSDGDLPEVRPAFHDSLVEYCLWKLHEMYAHTSKAFREKSLIHKGNYAELVAEADDVLGSGVDDQGRVVDVYGG